MQYRTPSPFFVPRRKSELINMIIESGGWTGTKTALKDMEICQLKAILIRIRNKKITDIMKNPLTTPK